MALCAAREMAPDDVRDKLLAWGLEDDELERVLERLIDEKYLDEERFARAFVHDKFLFNGWGRRKISYSLWQKGIDTAVVTAALEEGIDDEEYEAMARKLLKGKWSSVQGREPARARAALARFAADRGFEPALFFPLIDELVAGSDDDDDYQGTVE